MPSQLAVGSARHERRIDAATGILELQMAVLQEILTEKAEGQIFFPLPGEPSVEPSVGGDRRVDQTIDEVHRSIPSELAGQCDVAAQLGGVDGGVLRGVGDANGIVTAGIKVEMDALEGIARAKGPARQNLPVGEGFYAMRFAMHHVLREQWHDQMWRRRGVFEEESGRFPRFQIVIVVVIGSQVHGEILAQEGAVARLIGKQTLVLELRVSVVENFDRNAARTGKNGINHPHTCVHVGRSA